MHTAPMAPVKVSFGGRASGAGDEGDAPGYLVSTGVAARAFLGTACRIMEGSGTA
jgi:hypothetical protein